MEREKEGVWIELTTYFLQSYLKFYLFRNVFYFYFQNYLQYHFE